MINRLVVVVFLIAGLPMSDALGRRKVVLWSTVVFVLASAGAALSPSLKVLLAWRLIQGCSAGGGVIVGRAIIGDIAAGPIANRMIAHLMMIVALRRRLLRLRAVTFAALIAGHLLGGLSFCRCNLAGLGIGLSGVGGHSEDVAMHHVVGDETSNSE